MIRLPFSNVAFVFSLMLLFGVQSALGQEACYTDRGIAVCFPLGDISFADEVVAFSLGSPEPVAVGRDPSQALGPPNNNISEEEDTTAAQNSVTLGCGGILTLKFTNNALVDVEGADIYVFEIGNAVESTNLEISTDGVEWIDIGAIEGATATVDISEFVEVGDEFSHIRLTDLRTACGGDWSGADIDSVGAVGSTFVETGPHISFVEVGAPYEKIENAVMEIPFRVMMRFDVAPDEPPKSVRLFTKQIEGFVELDLEATDKPEIFVSEITYPSRP